MVKKTVKLSASRPEKEVTVTDSISRHFINIRLAGIVLGIIICLVVALYLIYRMTMFEALAKFNGGKVTRDEFIKVMRIETGKFDPIVWKNEVQAMKIKKDVLEELIKEKILLSLADKAKITVSDEEMKADLESYKAGYTENTFRNMLKSKGIDYDDWNQRKKNKFLIQKLIKKNVIDKMEISEEETKKYYTDHPEEFNHSEQVRARQILVNTWEDASKIEQELKRGGNFAAIAKKKSISPDRWKGGDLGFFSRGTHPEVFDQVCFGTPVGQTSQIIKSDFGYHIFKVIEKREPTKETLKDALKYIISQIQQERSDEAFKNWFKKIYTAADVEINYDSLKKIEVVADEKVGKY